ncbi:NADH-quinone oxidoreductase subunit A [Carboxydochorda subterranea]|uniref:NADH-quinone oxidoreductase subunit A n=1 Tax=Carboxydichorda subterranea TaxID=3109565 RepID=A0ABZ1C133_9FIRM|nr:NADH-quinone oxidoreductase subunit A [Limnochorda sp. L945t]WRP18588.1 NADH-quinone oxidoreductase subunit A [Limnochorda sp. L945t]
MSPYVDVAVFLITAVLFVSVTWGLSSLLRPHHPYARKLTTYECGQEPVGEAQTRFHIRYYIFALVFVIFDVETVFLYPWGVVFQSLGWAGLIEMAVFIGVLVVGLVYAWKRRVLHWT